MSGSYVWAVTQGHQGVVFRVLAERNRDLVRAQEAVTQINYAHKAMRGFGHEWWAAYFEAELSKARVVLDRLSK